MSDSLEYLHVLKLTPTSIQTATWDSTQWFLWVPRSEGVRWVDEPVVGALKRAHVPTWLMERHRAIILGAWSTSE